MNQKGVNVDARTCKHLKQLLGEDFETARISSMVDENKTKIAAAIQKGNRNGRKRKAESETKYNAPTKQPRNGNSPLSKPLITPDDQQTIAEEISTDDPLACIQGIQRTLF